MTVEFQLPLGRPQRPATMVWQIRGLWVPSGVGGKTPARGLWRSPHILEMLLPRSYHISYHI